MMKSKVITKKQAKACGDLCLENRKVGGLFVDTWSREYWDCGNMGMRIHLIIEKQKTREEKSWIFFKKKVEYTDRTHHTVAEYFARENCFIIEEGFEDLLDSVNMVVDYLIEIGKLAIEKDEQREADIIENRKRIASQFLGT